MQLRVINTLGAARSISCQDCILFSGAAKGKARKRRPKRTRGRLLFIHGLGSRVHTREADLVEGGAVTRGEGKPTTPKDTREQGDTNTQYNRQTTALRP